MGTGISIVKLIPPIPASLYNLSQLVRDVNSSPTQEDPGVPACSPRTEAFLQPVSLDWNAEVEPYAPLPPVLEEEEQDVRLNQDPCLPSPPAGLWHLSGPVGPGKDSVFTAI